MSKKRTKASARQRAASSRRAVQPQGVRAATYSAMSVPPLTQDVPGTHFEMSRGWASGGASDEQWEQLHQQFNQEHPQCPDCESQWAMGLANEDEGRSVDGQWVLSMSTICQAFAAAEDAGEEPPPHPRSSGGYAQTELHLLEN